MTFDENIRMAQQALTSARKLRSDNQRQVQSCSLVLIEVVRLNSDVAARLQDLIVAQTTMQQQAELIKTALSKQVSPKLADAELVPTDKLPEPEPDDIPPPRKHFEWLFPTARKSNRWT